MTSVPGTTHAQVRRGPSPAKSRRSCSSASAPTTRGVSTHSSVEAPSWRPIAPSPTTAAPVTSTAVRTAGGSRSRSSRLESTHDHAAGREHRSPHHGRDYRARVAALSSVESDLRSILWIQALRAFVYGFGVVVLGTALARSGLSDAEVTLVFTAMLAGMALASIVVGWIGDRVGRRRLYAILLALMGATGVVFALSESLWVLCVVALTGTMSTDANESGPITSLEQAMIGQAPAAARVHVFGRYNAVAYLAGAVGALAAGGPAFLRSVWSGSPGGQRWLLVFPLVAAVSVALALRLSPLVEGGDDRAERPLVRSRGNVLRLSALFATDAFAGGFVVASFLAFWFSRRFGASVELMSAVFFAGGLLQAGLLDRGGARGRAVRPAEHDGVHAPALEPAADGGAADALGGAGDRVPAGAVRAEPDGRADAAGLHRGDGRSRRSARPPPRSRTRRGTWPGRSGRSWPGR